ncbi:protein CIP2A isoform X1 [Astyanax mexicanus]|uniref:protein CIP2A isoform X1 n=1 Tax=Astyanax mexicanus TaxID=7994 RepID=UPI0020CAB840|nr:protein CIP2A isoform X1 [Astyanax mexicanus]
MDSPRGLKWKAGVRPRGGHRTLMDVTTCLKSLLLAIRQYKNNKSTLSSSQLQKQIEDVSGLKCSRLLTSGQVLPSECLSGLLEVAGDPNTSHALTGAILSLLSQLASDDESKEALHSSYSIVGTLAAIVHWNRATPEESVVLQCLQVLQRLTYNVRILHCASHIDELLNFLMLNIQSSNDDITKPCLGLIANLCRHNLSVQTQIKSQSNVKAFYRALINFLGHNCLTVVVFALSILSSLTLNEEVGQKLFNAKNIHQTFQLIFNITVNGDGTLTRNYAVDLLVDLLKNPKIADYLTNYKHLPVCLNEVVGLLHGKDPDTAVKVLELLVSLCSVPALRRLCCETVIRPVALRLPPGVRSGAQTRGPEPCLDLLQWATGPLQGPEQCSLLALSLLTELFEEVIDSSLSGSAHSFVELLLPALQGLLQAPDPSEGEQLLRRHCVRAGRTVDLLLVLCGEDFLKTLVSQHMSSELCAAQVELMLSNTQDYIGSSCSGSDSQLSQLCSETVLKTLELMSQLKQQVPDMETRFYRILQDQRMVMPLSLALTSNRRECVQTALRILFEAAPLPDFPAVILGESIAANNAYRHREAERAVRGSTVQGDGVSFGKSFSRPSTGPSGPSGQNIDSLIEKLQSGIQLQEPMKDVHMSEIIDVYEQKISALASKEGRLQDLLEAKALALSQADRLIAQYRCQRAQAEAEARKLASLLKETERRKEELQAELSVQVLEVEKLKTDSHQLLQHNSRLQTVSDEHQNLKGTYNQLLSRYNKNEGMLKELQAAHISLTQQAEGLRKSNEGFKLQQERLSAELVQKEQHIATLEETVQEKRATIAGLQAEMRRQEEQASEMEESMNILRKELNKTEQARKEASIKASSLELQKAQVESRLQKREEELSKHTQMIAMIHSLSSGKLKNDASANLSL